MCEFVTLDVPLSVFKTCRKQEKADEHDFETCTFVVSEAFFDKKAKARL